MKTSSAKAKGRRLQQEVRNAILATFPELQPDDVKVAIMGERGVDIHLSPAAQRVVPHAIECKNVERLNIHQAVAQARANAGSATWAVVFRRNNTEPAVVISMHEWLRLLESDAREFRRLEAVREWNRRGNMINPTQSPVVRAG